MLYRVLATTALITAILVLTLVGVGCGSDSDNDRGGFQGQPAVTSGQQTPPTPPIRLEMPDNQGEAEAGERSGTVAGTGRTDREPEVAMAAIPEDAPVIRVDDPSHDFGEIEQDARVSHTFVIHNDGAGELVIQNIRSTCGCTVATPTLRQIPPGAISELRVTFNPANRSGNQRKRVTLTTNDPRNPDTSLEIRTHILVDVEFTPRRIIFREMARGETRQETIVIKNAGRRDIVITDISPANPEIEVRSSGGDALAVPLSLSTGRTVELQVSFTYPEDPDTRFFHGTVQVKVEGREDRPFELSIAARVRRESRNQ